jgi:hypothetical protein
LEEDLAQMKEQMRGYRLQLDNTAESVAAREERNREAKKGLRQKTREINTLEEERARLVSTRGEGGGGEGEKRAGEGRGGSAEGGWRAGRGGGGGERKINVEGGHGW